MTAEERQEIMESRKRNRISWHSPPHLDLEGEHYYLFTAACFEHTIVIGQSLERMAECEFSVLSLCRETDAEVFAWCILPNHYHLLFKTSNIQALRHQVKLFHGRSSRKWNLEDSMVGRQVWHSYFERPLKSERHFWASLNYVHHNAVHHGLVDHWQDWPFSSARQYLETIGREKAAEIWKQYPILDYGKKWDI